MKNVVVIGAGRLGKGFIGETFANSSNWNINFIDKDKAVVDALRNDDGFNVTVHRVDRIDTHNVKEYNAYTWNDEESEKCVVQADLIVFTIYPEQIYEAVLQLCKCLKNRCKDNGDANLSIIFITNKNHLMGKINELFSKTIGKENKKWLNEKVAISDSIVRRSTDAESNVSLNIRTTAVLSLLIQKPLNIDVSDVEWFELTDNLELLKDLKVFIVNGPHASGAYLGHYLGYDTFNEVCDDKYGAKFIDDVNKEIRAGILSSYPISEKELDNLSVFPQAKGEMVDYIYRVAYDPIRKLSKGDRLSGSAEICYKKGLPYSNLAKAMAYGFLYDNENDDKAVELQNRIKLDGIENTLEKITGFDKDHEVAKLVLKFYNEFKSNK